MGRIRSLGRASSLGLAMLLAPVLVGAGGLTFVEHEQGLPVDTQGLVGAIAVAISPDGLHVYAVAFREDTISVWDRDPVTNAVTFKEKEGPFTPGLKDPQGVAVSPDGACVFVATRGNEPGPGGGGNVASFSRDLVTGALTYVGFVEDGNGADGIRGAIDVTVSPNSAHVYVAGEGDDAVAAFSQTNCFLTQIDVEFNGVGGVDGLRLPQNVAISPDGLHVYLSAAKTIANTTFGTVAVFSRGGGGDLTFVEFEQEGVAGVERLTERVEGLAVSPDGGSVYAGSRGGDAIVAFDRDAGTGALTYVETERRTGLAKGFKGATGVAVSPDSAYVYAVGRGDDAIAVFARDAATGALDFLEVHDDPVPGMNVLGSIEDVAVSPDGTGVYTVAYGADSLAAFTADRCGNGGVGIDEQCDDGCLAGTPGVCEPADDGDGCSSTCRLELCGPAPSGACHAATSFGGASLQIKDQSEDRKDQLKWSWKGQTTPLAQFGDPLTAASYVICLYDGSGNPQPLLAASAPAGGTCNGKPCWKAKPTSYQYGDKYLTPDSLKKIHLREGLVDGKPKVQVQGAGIFLDPPALPLALPVTVQVKNTQNAECWEAVYGTADKNEPAQFKAKSD